MRSINVYKLDELPSDLRDKAVSTVKSRYSKSLIRTYIANLIDEESARLTTLGFNGIKIVYRNRFHFSCSYPDIPKILDKLKISYDKSNNRIKYALLDIEISEYYNRLEDKHMLSYNYVDEFDNSQDKELNNEAFILMTKVLDYLESEINIMNNQVKKYSSNLTDEFFSEYSIGHSLEFTEDGKLIMIKSH